MPAPLTVATFLAARSLADLQLSPDGRRVAYVAAARARVQGRVARALWVAPTDGSAVARRFTHGDSEDYSPRWSPDGRTLAFLSDRGNHGIFALCAISASGGEALPLHGRRRSIAAFSWSPDGRHILFLAPDERPTSGPERTSTQGDAHVYGADWRVARLHILHLATGIVQTLSTGERHVAEAVWSPDGGRIAFLARRTPEPDEVFRTELLVIPAAGGEVHLVCRAIAGGYSLLWPGDGDHLLYLAGHDATPQSDAAIWRVHAMGGEPSVIGPGIDDPAACWSVTPVAGTREVAAIISRGLAATAVLLDPLSGRAQSLTDAADGVAEECAACIAPGATTQTLAVLRSTGATPPEVWAGAPGTLCPVSDHHAALAEIAFGGQEPFAWQAADKTTLDGLLIRPPDAPAGPLPMIVLLSYAAWTDRFQFGALNWAQWLATHGYAMLLPNCRGGIGHGHRFAASLRGDLGGVSHTDLMAAVDAAIARGIADPDRMGVGGWSQGGYMTAWAVTQTDRFKAGVMGAGISDWRMMALTSDLPTFQTALSSDRPWDGSGPHSSDARSPIAYARRVRTPLLILHGEDDSRVPVGQGTGFARALRERDVPVELVTYPREGHGIGEWEHQRDLLLRVRGWYDRWLRPQSGT